MARKKMSKYASEVHENTVLLHYVIFNENYKHGYAEKLQLLSHSRTFNKKDFDAVIFGIAFTHGIDITRIDVTGIDEMVREPELG